MSPTELATIVESLLRRTGALDVDSIRREIGFREPVKAALAKLEKEGRVHRLILARHPAIAHDPHCENASRGRHNHAWPAIPSALLFQARKEGR